MSFVLEALKKQEAGSDPEAAVSLARSAAQHRRHRFWIGLFAVAMIVNAALLLWIFATPDPSGTTTPVATTAPGEGPAQGSAPPPARARPGGGTAAGGAIASVEATAPPEGAIPGERSSPDRNEVRAGSRAEPPPTPEPQRPPAPPAPTRVALNELPAEARARFPGIAFSTHIYAEDADLRAVVANGRRLQEGDRIRGLEIVEITESGVLLAFDRYRVDVPIVMDWDSL